MKVNLNIQLKTRNVNLNWVCRISICRCFDLNCPKTDNNSRHLSFNSNSISPFEHKKSKLCVCINGEGKQLWSTVKNVRIILLIHANERTRFVCVFGQCLVSKVIDQTKKAYSMKNVGSSIQFSAQLNECWLCTELFRTFSTKNILIQPFRHTHTHTPHTY